MPFSSFRPLIYGMLKRQSSGNGAGFPLPKRINLQGTIRQLVPSPTVPTSHDSDEEGVDTVNNDYGSASDAFVLLGPSESDEGSIFGNNKSSTASLGDEEIERLRYGTIYPFATDEEKERLSYLNNFVIALDIGRRSIDQERILDIGAGARQWAMHMGDRHRSASIEAVDINPNLLPAYVPPNVRTICDNVEYPWEVKGEIDFVHCRAMAGAIKDWRLLVHNIHGWLRQGGWVEFHEFGTTFYASDGSELDFCHPFVELMNAVLGVCDVIEQTLDPMRYLPQWLSDAGFTQIEKISVKIDMIARDQYVGKGCDNFDLFLTRILPLTYLLSNKLSWSTARVDNLRRRVERAIATDNVKMDYLIFRGAKDG